jgi:zinc and cadmium transporter
VNATIAWIAFAVALEGAVGLSGAIVPDRWLARHRLDMLGFAIGALVASAILDLIPAAIAQIDAIALLWVLLGVVVLALVELVLARSRGGRRAGLPYTLLGSDAIHNFGDGMAIAAAFLVSHRLGAVTSLAVIVHEVPEELADYGVLRAAGWRKGAALAWLTAVQLTAALGAATTLAGVHALGVTGPALAIGAGTFLYIAAVDLAPEIARATQRRSALGWMGVGVAVMTLVS